MRRETGEISECGKMVKREKDKPVSRCKGQAYLGLLPHGLRWAVRRRTRDQTRHSALIQRQDPQRCSWDADVGLFFEEARREVGTVVCSLGAILMLSSWSSFETGNRGYQNELQIPKTYHRKE